MFGGLLFWGGVPLRRTEAGVCARRRSNFLLSRQEKVTKEKATLHAASLRFAAGNLWCSCVGRAAELATRCALRSNNRSESVDKGVCPAAHARPTPCAPRRTLKGTQRDPTALRAIAALGPDCAARGACARELGPSAAMDRMAVWMFGAPPLLAAPATGRLRGEHGRRSAHAAWSDSPWLSERRAQRKASSTAHPATAPTQVCPVAQRRGRRLGVAFSLVTFFWRSKRKLLACRATPGLRLQQRHAPRSAQGFDKQSLNGCKTIKTIATSAL
jgi:hypothetical protein